MSLRRLVSILARQCPTHTTGLLVAALLFFLTTGCSNVRLANLQSYSPENFPARDSAKYGKPSGTYVVRDEDEIELRVPGKAPLALVSDSGKLLHDIDSIRVTYGLLRSLTTLELIVGSPPSQQIIKLGGAFTEGATWDEVRQKLEQDTVAKELKLATTIRAKPSLRLLPGDAVSILRTHVAVDGASKSATVISSNHSSTIVDRDGYLAIPLFLSLDQISEVTGRGEELLVENERVAVPAYRRVSAQLEEAYGRIRAWSPDWSSEQWPTLTEIGECLATVPFQAKDGCHADVELPSGPQLPAGFAERCRMLGIGSHLRICPATAGNVHYRLTAPTPTWTLVDTNGHRITTPLREDLTVVAAAKEQYRRLRGRELVLPGLFHRDAFLTVLPDPRSFDRGAFTIRVHRDKPLDEPDPLLLPGDTVFLGRTSPESIGGAR